ncbi:MAG: hypothetical protein JNL58_23600 [Planctomyces sp.]|nr:hypothetical protein [Planctomyces sp.]
MLFVTATAVAAVGLIIVSIIALTSGSGPDKFGDLLAKSQSKDTDPVDPELERMKREAEDRRKEEELQKEKQLASEKAEKERKAEEARVAQEKGNADAMAKAKAESERKMAEERRLNALREEGPFAFIKASVNAKDGEWHDEHGQWLFELPKPGAGEKSKPLPLRTLLKPVTLRLFEGARGALEENNFNLAIEANPEVPSEWRLVIQMKASTLHVGSYTLETLDTGGNPEKPDLEMRFEWMQEASREPMACELARWWPLEIQVGDQTERAVLLQRPPFVPLDPPTMADFLAGKELVFLSGAELKCLGDNAAKAMTFRMQLAEPGHAPQSLECELTEGMGNVEETEDGEAAENPDLGPLPNRAFFSLSTPIVISRQSPAVAKAGVGFGSIVLNPKFSEGVLTLKSHIDLRVKLPSKEALGSLPTGEINAFLDKIAATRDTEERVRLLSNFNPDLAGREIDQVESWSGSYFDDTSRWYAHPFQKRLPAKATWKVPFFELKVKASKAVEAAIRVVAKDRPALDDRDDRDKLRESLSGFSPAMDRLEAEVREAVDLLMKDFDEIQTQRTAVQTALLNSRIRFVALTRISTPEAINGDELNLSVLDSDPTWGEDFHQGRAVAE